MIDAVNHYDGHIVQSTGDGIFALFGAPVAHEDHPQRALYAALRIQEQVRRYADRLRAEGRPPLQIRIGVNTGEVVVRSIRTAEARSEYTPIGHTANLAARMQTLADPGSTITTESTRRLAEGYFTLRPLGLSRVKGLAEPINIYEVTGLGPLRTRLQRAAARGLTKFVGRQREMDALKHAAEQAQAGHGQIVAVMADAGVGKSRLFYEFKATSQSSWMVLEAFSVSHGKASAYLPVLELLSQYFEIGRDDDDRKRGERILGKVLRLDRNLEDTLPFLYSLHGIAEWGDSLAQMEPQVRRRRTMDAIKRILVRESLNQPLMIIFEDLHWIDGETQALLNLLVDSIANARILLLVNYRPEYRHEWGGRTHYMQLRLDPLPIESADEMLSALLGDEEDLAPLKRLIIERTQGTPFFIEEVVQALFEQEVIERNGVVKLAKPISTVKVPATIQAVLASRIDRLPRAEKELLQSLAVLGREFSMTLVQRVTSKSTRDLEQMLRNLQLSEYINEQPAIGDIEYTFKHALTQEVASNSILAERRKALHQRAGEAIEQLFAERLDDYAIDLARHFERSGNPGKAVEYLERAGRRALEQAAHSEVTEYVTRALQLVKQLSDEIDRSRHELELQMTLSASLHMAVGPASLEREVSLGRALELCERLDDSRVMEVMLSLGTLRWARGEPFLSLQLFERPLALGEQRNDAEVAAAAHSGIGFSLLALGEFVRARKHFECAIELSQHPTRRFGQVLVLILAAQSLLADTLLALGYPTTALKRSAEALDLRQKWSQPYINGLALAAHIMRHLQLHNISGLAGHVDELITITTEHEMPVVYAHAAFYSAWLVAHGGRVGEGVTEMLRIIRQLGVYPLVDRMVITLAEVCAANRLPDEGLATITEALTRSEKAPGFHAEFYRLKGELTLLSDSHNESEAERCLRQAIEIAQRQAARLFEIRATTSLARLLLSQGRHDEARSMLAEIYNWFNEGFDLLDLQQAKALLDELSC
jgi:tetratricopeptide (TPR) repeat protein